MDYAKPSDVVASMIDAGVKKLALGPRDLLIRGALSGCAARRGHLRSLSPVPSPQGSRWSAR